MGNPINCFPSNFRESVESDGEEEGEEFVLSRCPSRNLFTLRGDRWRLNLVMGTREDPLVDLRPPPVVKLRREELEIRSLSTFAPT